MKDMTRRGEPLFRKRGGFTIAEILVALLITSIIAGVIYGAYMGSVRIIYRAQEDCERATMARLVLDRISSDLQCAFLREYREYLLFVGMDSGEGQGGADILTFTAANHSREGRDAAESDLCELSYFLDADEEGEAYVLLREDPTLDEDPFAGGETRIIAEGIAGLDFEYFDGEAWLSSWDSREDNALPRAARITLLFRTEEAEKGEEEDDETVRYTRYKAEVAIPLGGSWEEEEGEQQEQTKGIDDKDQKT